MKFIDISETNPSTETSSTTSSEQTFAVSSFDICQVVRCKESPTIPLRMELNCDGFEVVRTRNNTGFEECVRKLEEARENLKSKIDKSSKKESSVVASALSYKTYAKAEESERTRRLKQKTNNNGKDRRHRLTQKLIKYQAKLDEISEAFPRKGWLDDGSGGAREKTLKKIKRYQRKLEVISPTPPASVAMRKLDEQHREMALDMKEGPKVLASRWSDGDVQSRIMNQNERCRIDLDQPTYNTREIYKQTYSGALDSSPGAPHFRWQEGRSLLPLLGSNSSSSTFNESDILREEDVKSWREDYTTDISEKGDNNKSCDGLTSIIGSQYLDPCPQFHAEHGKHIERNPPRPGPTSYAIGYSIKSAGASNIFRSSRSSRETLRQKAENIIAAKRVGDLSTGRISNGDADDAHARTDEDGERGQDQHCAMQIEGRQDENIGATVSSIHHYPNQEIFRTKRSVQSKSNKPSKKVDKRNISMSSSLESARTDQFDACQVIAVGRMEKMDRIRWNQSGTISHANSTIVTSSVHDNPLKNVIISFNSQSSQSDSGLESEDEGTKMSISGAGPRSQANTKLDWVSSEVSKRFNFVANSPPLRSSFL